VLLAHVPHPGLSRFVDRGRTDDGSPYLVMELLRGQTLARRLEIGPMALPDVLDIAVQAADALDAVHAAGVIHCDLKPDNLFLVPDPVRASRYRVVIIDFGVASVRALHALKSGSAGQRRLIGTPSYMAPEQCRVRGALDPRTDVYGLGCLVYEMLCGDAPFCGNIAEVLDAHQTAVAPAPSRLRAETPEALDALVLAMLAKEPEGRPSSMAIVRAGLESAMSR
jgi:serine/threonine protein kinase